MTVDTWNSIFGWASVTFAVLAALSGAGVIVTQHYIDRRKDTQISTLQARHIMPQQREELIALLTPIQKPQEPIYFNPIMSDGEAVQFSEEIKSVLEASGFKTRDVDFRDKLLGFSLTGQFLDFKDGTNQPQAARYIFEAFKRVGIIFQGLPEPQCTDTDKVIVIVGTHP
jgi:hypothetical protein